jgi:DNA-binding MarR family transcriptional regulator
MEQAGDVTRQTNPNDGRARTLALTAKGDRVARQVDEASARYFSDLAHQLGLDAPEVIKTLGLLQRAMVAAAPPERHTA